MKNRSEKRRNRAANVRPKPAAPSRPAADPGGRRGQDSRAAGFPEWATSLGWSGGLGQGLVVLGLMGALVRLNPRTVWDVDPAAALVPDMMMGPVGLSVLHGVVILMSGAALLAAGLRGMRVRWWIALLLLPGMVAALAWWWLDVEGRATSGAWAAGSAAALALSVVACDRRIVGIAALLFVGMAVVWSADAIAYVTWDHPRTVESFRETEEAFLAARGWQRGSPEHQKFERRLMFSDATGPFGLSNVNGTWLAGTALLAAVAMVGGYRRGSMLPWVLAGCVAAALVGLYLTRARGAMLILAGLGPLIVIPVLMVRAGLGNWVRKACQGRAWRGWLMLVGLISGLLVTGGVVVVGLLKEAEPGSFWLSIIFRWHYLHAVWAMILDHGGLGVSPGRFQEMYQLYRPVFSPEVVTSAHHAVLDWWAMIGVLGALWGAMWALALAKCGWAAGVEHGAERSSGSEAGGSDGVWPADKQEALGLALVVTLVLAGFKWSFEWQGIAGWSGLVRNLGLIGFFGVVWQGLLCLDERQRWANGLALWAMAVIVWAHGQMDMSFHQPSSAMLTWILLGLVLGGAGRDEGSTKAVDAATQAPGAASGREAEAESAMKDQPVAGSGAGRSEFSERAGVGGGGGRRPDDQAGSGDTVVMGLGAGLLVVGLAALMLISLPMHRRDLWMQHAADAWRAGNPFQAEQMLLEAHAVVQRDWFALLRASEVMLWRAESALEQGDELQAARLADRVLRGLADRPGVSPGPFARQRLRLRANLLLLRMADAESPWAQQAEDELRGLIRRAPNEMRFHLELAEFLWELGRLEEAAVVYRRVLEIDEALKLDPADQLAPEVRDRVRLRALTE